MFFCLTWPRVKDNTIEQILILNELINYLWHVRETVSQVKALIAAYCYLRHEQENMVIFRVSGVRNNSENIWISFLVGDNGRVDILQINSSW